MSTNPIIGNTIIGNSQSSPGITITNGCTSNVTVTTTGGGGGGIVGGVSYGSGYSTYTYTYPSISTEKLDVGGVDIGDCMKNIMNRLAILEEPSPEKLEKYHSLKKAYENYKMLEKLFIDEGDK